MRRQSAAGKLPGRVHSVNRASRKRISAPGRNRQGILLWACEPGIRINSQVAPPHEAERMGRHSGVKPPGRAVRTGFGAKFPIFRGPPPRPGQGKSAMSQEKKQLKLADEFTFACHKGLDCYTSCCRDVNIFLSPWDVARLKNALGITSTQFLDKYTDLVVVPGKQLPLVQLRMNPDDNLKCFFVHEYGCEFYGDRPWACRMFPLDEAGMGGFTVVGDPKKCHGLIEGDQWQVKEWLKDQGATQSKEADGSWEALSAHEWLPGLDVENEQIQQMIILALYDVDRFREMVLNSSFLDRFELEDERIEAVKNEDVAVMDLGFDWVRFGLFGQLTLKLKDEAKQAAEARAEQLKDHFEARLKELK